MPSCFECLQACLVACGGKVGDKTLGVKERRDAYQEFEHELSAELYSVVVVVVVVVFINIILLMQRIIIYPFDVIFCQRNLFIHKPREILKCLHQTCRQNHCTVLPKVS